MINLREYQKEISDKGVEILRNNKILMLSMEVRTGKTLTALATAEKYGAKKVLFVTKKKAIKSIESDYNLMQPAFDIEVINYESIHKIGIIPDLVICDEIHCISAFPKPSNRAKNIKLIVKKLPLIGLSGTMTPESFSQIYHILWISDNSPFKTYISFYKWAKDFVNVKKKYLYNREINDYSEANKSKIDQYTEHLFISFTQKESGFDVQLTEKVLYVDMPSKINKAAQMLLKDNIIEGTQGTVIADTAVKLQQKLHQIYSGTVKDEDGNIIIISDYKAKFIKQKFNGQRIAIFYKFIGEFNVLKDGFQEDWTNSPEQFQKGEKSVYLGQFVSSREGIRLDEADCIIFYNIDFSYLSYAQAKDRIISKERTKEAILYWIFSNGGIESKIYEAVKNKSDYTVKWFRNDFNLKKIQL